MSEPSLLHRLGESRRLPAYVLLAGLLVSLPALKVGLYADDFLHRATARGLLPSYERGATELYAFTPADPDESAAAREFGGLAWFTDEDLSLRFFRPIPSALLVLELELFGATIWPTRLHSMIWFALLLLLATALFRRFLSAPAAAAAALIYALSVVHMTGLAWLAARYGTIAATVGLASVWAHVRAREDHWRPGLALAPLLLAVAYVCGESAIAAAGLILFYELSAPQRPLRQRLLALVPITSLTLVYVVWYQLAGYGVAGSAVYISPVGEPLTLLAVAAWRVPALLGNTLAAAPSEIAFAAPAARPALAAIGLVSAIAIGVVAWRLRKRMDERERRTLTWMVAGALPATVLFSASPPGGRVLPLIMVCSAALLGTVVAHAWAASKPSTHGSGGRRLAWRVIAIGLVVVHLGLSPLVRVGATLALAEQGAAVWALSRSLQQPCAPEMVLVAASDPAIFFYAPVAGLLDGKQPPKSLRVLSMAPQDHRIENVSVTGFDLVTVGPRRVGTWEHVVRAEPMRAGDVVALATQRFHLVEVQDGRPTRLRVDFGKPLTSPDLCFVDVRDGAFVELAPPRPGETLLLPHAPGPSGM